jgi:hypothetical protein
VRLYQLWGVCDFATKGLLVFAATVELRVRGVNQFGRF